MKIVLVSFFNSNNLGDLLLSEILEKSMLEFGTVQKFSFSGDTEVKTHTESAIPRSSFKRKCYIALNCLHLDFLIQLYRKYFPPKNEALENAIQCSDCLVIGGGNMLFDLEDFSSSARQFDFFVDIARKYSKVIFAITIGIGPFHTPEQSEDALKSLEKCDYITFRDPRSYQYYIEKTDKRKNVYLSIDPAFTLEPKIVKTDAREKIGLSLVDNKLWGASETERETLIKKYTELIKEVYRKTQKDIIIFSSDRLDYGMVYDVKNKLSKHPYVKIREVNQMKDLEQLYTELRCLIGTRMHSMIIAYKYSIPVVGLVWQTKVRAMFEQLELETDAYDLSELEIRIPQIVDNIYDKLCNTNQWQRKMKDNLARIMDRNNINKLIMSDIKGQIENEGKV